MNERHQSSGYVTDSGYADTFFRELSPVWLNYVARVNGVPPRNLDEFAYLELGCGFGSSAIVNAGAFPHGEFHACDINPAHIEGGRRQASALGVENIRFHQGSFDSLLARDLPRFDFIALHGVYSWVGEDARLAIRRVIERTSKPGGLVYVSYNSLPGWSIEAPLRKLFVELSASSTSASAERAEHARGAMERLRVAQLRYFKTNPAAAAAVESYARRSGNYLAHEFLNQTWEPFYAIDVADEMGGAGLSYLGSATLVDNHPALVMDAAAAEAVAALPTERQRRLAADFAVNQRFRRDVFVRGRGARDESDAARHLQSAIIGIVASPDRISTKVRVPRGEITFQADFVDELQSLVRGGSMALGDMVAALGGRGRNEREIARNLLFLVAAGTLTPFANARRFEAPRAHPRAANERVERVLNDVVRHRVSRAIPCEALGNGVEIRPIDALAVTEWLNGTPDVETLRTRLLAAVRRTGIDLVHNGTESESAAEADQAMVVARNAVEQLVPSFMRLGLIV